MKRSIILILAAAVALGGCSGKAEEAPAAPAPAKQANGAKPHVNPWAKDAPATAAK
jgi:PBP1b-binding outer membrane lipoprotein LpoB